MKKSPLRSLCPVLTTLMCWWCITLTVCLTFGANSPAVAKRIPVILDTDIGDDIDDTWALGLLLASPELDLKLVVSDYGRPQYRGRLLGKLLERFGRPDVPIGLGIEVAGVGGVESQAKWLGDYTLDRYPGKVHADGVQALVDTIMAAPEPITLIAIGPLPNIAAALQREPRIAERARFVGMHGSVRRGYGGGTTIAAEWNVKCAPRAAQAVFQAPWDKTITPLDTCGVVDLFGGDFTRLRDSASPRARIIMENYRVWAAARADLAPKQVEERSSTLFDCVAIYLAQRQDLCRMERLNLRVTDDGFTRVDPTGNPVSTATGWVDLNGFRRWMTDRLTAPSTPADCSALAQRCRALLTTNLLDFYLPAAVDAKDGGFFEVLKDGRFVPAADKFLTLQARQTWFFSTMSAEGIERERTLAAARHGFEFLQRAFLDRTNGGYFSKVTQAGQPLDSRKHAYLNSFALYALAAYHRASGDATALQAAQNLFGVMDARMHDAVHGGYHEFFHADWRPVNDPEESGYVGAIGTKTYNTHLHLMESFAELYRQWPDSVLRGRLAELLTINTCTVRVPQHNSNVDGWQPDWTMIATPANQRASYGHDLECAWLALDAAHTLGQPPVLLRSWAESLCQTSLRFGYDTEHGGLFLSGPLGQPAEDRRKEWWVQAEALVGLLELHRMTGERSYFDRFTQTLDFIERYQVAREGGWWATRETDGSPHANTSRTSPWQGAYHNGRALLLCAKALEQMSRQAP